METYDDKNNTFYSCDCPGCTNRIQTDMFMPHSNRGLPDNWYFLAIGTGAVLEAPEIVKHFCSKEHAEMWLFHNQGMFED